MNKPSLKLVTGGQTGVDRACLDLAIDFDLDYGGWCPKGRIAEDGIIDRKYSLIETESENVAVRTELNARDSDGTIVLTIGEPTDGTVLTFQMAMKYKKPLLLLHLDQEPKKDSFNAWVKDNSIKTLNVAGPRESHLKGQVYNKSYSYLKVLLDL